MWGWLLNHWWVATLGPYLGFNIYLTRLYLREALGGPGYRLRAFLILIAGLWGLLALIIGYACAQAWLALRTLTLPARPPMRQVRRWAINALLWCMFFLLGAAVYGGSLATTNYQPSQFESWAIIIIIILGATHGVKWIRKELARP